MKNSTLSALLSSESNDWYTPSAIIEAAREVMGTIDLDPASCAMANETVRAARYYTKQENGLMHPWPGKIFLNPPYGTIRGKSNQAIWSSRLISQYEQGITEEAILLVNAATSEKWFQPLYDYLICFPVGRLKFATPERSDATSPTHASALVYFGVAKKQFVEVFNQFGPVVTCAYTRDKVSLIKPELF
jgi:ParB family chromosome partitioning protein